MVQISISYLLKELTDTALGGDITSFYKFLYLSIAVGIIQAGLAYAGTQVKARFINLTKRDFRHHLARKIQNMPVSILDRYHSADLVTRQNDNIDHLNDYLLFVVELIYQPLILIFSVAFIVSINWKMMLIYGTVTPLAAPIFNRISKPMQKLYERLKESQAKASAVAEDTIRGVHVFKAFSLHEPLAQKYNGILQSILLTTKSIIRMDSILLFCNQVLRYLPMLCSITLAGYLAYRGEMSLGGALTISTTMIWCTAGPVEAMLALISRTRETIPVANRIFEILDQPDEIEVDGVMDRHAGAPAIEFKNVAFAYPDAAPIFENLSFQVQPGEIVAVVGSSGCGKTTLMKMICGLYPASAGTISLFGNRMEGDRLVTLRRFIAPVFQDVHLFPVGIRENIQYGNRTTSQREVENAATIANVHSFVMRLPQEYETVLQEGAVNLSGGEKQRLSIARAVLKDAPILVLDEPTAALDTQSEADVQEAVDRATAGKTVLIIAHRLSTIKNVDRILVLDQGQIVEEGTHAELMLRDSLYRRLYEKQLAGNEVAQ